MVLCGNNSTVRVFVQYSAVYYENSAASMVLLHNQTNPCHILVHMYTEATILVLPIRVIATRVVVVTSTTTTDTTNTDYSYSNQSIGKHRR